MKRDHLQGKGPIHDIVDVSHILDAEKLADGGQHFFLQPELFEDVDAKLRVSWLSWPHISQRTSISAKDVHFIVLGRWMSSIGTQKVYHQHSHQPSIRLQENSY